MTRPSGWRLADEPHHDGSTHYLHRHSDSAAATTATTTIARVRVPDACGTTRVRLRTTPDGEPAITEAALDAVMGSREHGATWWTVEIAPRSSVTNYRFLLEGGALGRCWLNSAGVFHRDVTDDADFRITTAAPPPPAWLDDAVGYQIFIDRFADSGTPRTPPDWAIEQRWHDPVDPTPGVRSRQFYGGDLAGVEQHLDHLERLGVTMLYLTPFFPAGSSHRYDASTFAHVDAALGGDGALVSLVTAAHRRGIRAIGDITLNHTGDRHEWFTHARADPDAAERGYYFFDDDEPYGYVAWHDVASLPKLDHRSADLRRHFYEGPHSVAARFLSAPFDLDGWRVDCANTTARHGVIDDNHDVARTLRATMDGFGGNRWLVAEHCYDAADDLDGTGWHGVMAYQWFTRPLWGWLKGPSPRSLMAAVDLIDVDGVGLVESMRHLSANVSWQARASSMTMLDSHDTARFRTVVDGDESRHLVGLAALLTMPGVPTLFAGSELGVEGDTMDTARVPFPWATVDDAGEFLDRVRVLVDLRRTSRALQTGSLRWVDAGADSVTFVRETDDELVLVHLVRATTSDVRLMLDDLGVSTAHGREMVVRYGARGAVVTDVPSRAIVLRGTPGATVVSFPHT